ncbi:hypothetical protein GCM10025870_26560 [Agromyces marinus]|uniref:Integral membrane protein n=1 Tax=Agromyces marinus TaxID=1389020 RepID=A0ABM8H463_9MICO|nr:hypothetical protein [Agromyces marinus]BDZ55583.1 hypothetical protein GCM10025870_26560 [Agromyces marinus]
MLGLLGALLAGLGAFGHAVTGGARLLQVALAGDGEADAALAAFGASESGVFVPYLLFGLVGTALGLILLSVAIMRSRIAPLWVPITLIAWVVIEFALSGLTPWAPYLALVVGLIGFVALIVAVWRSDLTVWSTEAEARAAGSTGPSMPAEPAGATDAHA